jgi:hypothetical protein
MGCGSGCSGRYRTVRAAPNLHVWHGSTCGSETEQGLKSGHRCLAAIVTENKLIQVNLELLATHAVIGPDQPLLQVPNGPIGQWHHRFRAFAKVALQGLGTRNMPESHLFKSGEVSCDRPHGVR